MKINAFPVLCITAISIISGYLMSKASLIGRAGMSLFYREYNFLKVWWKGGLLIWIALLVLFGIQGWIRYKFPFSKSRNIQIIALVISIAGLYFTYNDFRHTFSHRLLGERFHLGVYLFWLSWTAISIYYLTQPKVARSSTGKGTTHAENQDTVTR